VWPRDTRRCYVIAYFECFQMLTMVLHFTMSRHHPFLAAHTSTEHIRTKRSVYQCKRRGQGAMQDASMVLLPRLFQNDAAEVRHELLPSPDRAWQESERMATLAETKPPDRLLPSTIKRNARCAGSQDSEELPIEIMRPPFHVVMALLRVSRNPRTVLHSLHSPLVTRKTFNTKTT
jgi:hypothetical protein